MGNKEKITKKGGITIKIIEKPLEPEEMDKAVNKLAQAMEANRDTDIRLAYRQAVENFRIAMLNWTEASVQLVELERMGREYGLDLVGEFEAELAGEGLLKSKIEATAPGATVTVGGVTSDIPLVDQGES